jgi:tetratricopeptide (TPR) repeat protein
MEARHPCPDSALLAAFLDGALADYERTAVVTHLADCAECRAVALTVVEFREVQALDDIWDAESHPAQEAREETRVARWTSRKTRAPAFLVAAAVVVAGVVLFVSLPVVPTEPPTRAASSSPASVTPSPSVEARLADGMAVTAPDVPPAAEGHAHLVLTANGGREDDDRYGAATQRAIGVAALRVGDLDDAVSSLSIASLAAPNDARIANDLAAAYYERAKRGGRVEDLPAALEAAERATQMSAALQEAWFNRALIISAMGLRTEARAAWQQCAQHYDPASPWAAEARRREQELAQAMGDDDWNVAVTTFEQRAAAELAQQAVTIHPSKARELFEKYLREWTTAVLNDRDGEHFATRLRILGDAFHRVQNERFYQDIASSIDVAVRARSQRQLARVHQEFFNARKLLTGDSSLQALKELQRLSPSLVRLESPLALRARVETATAHYFLGSYHADTIAALPSLRAAAVAKGYRVIAARASWIGGMAAFSRRDLAGARVAYEEMLDSTNPPADMEQRVMANALLAGLHDVLGNDRDAWAYRLDAIAGIDDVETELTKTQVFFSSAARALADGHLATALLFQARFQPPAGDPNPISDVQARIQRANTLHRLGNGAAATLELHRARERLASIADPRMVTALDADLLGLESELVQRTDPERALKLAERAVQSATRRRDFFRMSQLQLRLADAALANGQLERADNAATSGIAVLEAMRRSAGKDASAPSVHELPLYSKAAQIALHRGDFARAFFYTENRRLKTLYQDRHPPVPLALGDVQRRLNADTALTILTQLDDRLAVWVLTRDDVGVHAVEMSNSRAAALVSSQLQELSRQSTPTVSGELFDTIFKPVWGNLRGIRNMAVVADAPYSHVAFAGLWDASRDKYLVEDFRLILAPTATTFARGTAPISPARRNGAGVAIVSASHQGSASDTRDALTRELHTLYQTAELRTGEAATPTEVLDQIARHEVIHISARVSGSGDARDRTRLLIADEPGRKYSGSVSAAQLARLSSPRARLVALDTDVTGAHVPARSDGPQEVALALLAAGVPTVIGRVGAFPTDTLSPTWVEFHRQFAAGKPAAESLQRAQLAALSASQRRAGPWATLTVFGSYQ